MPRCWRVALRRRGSMPRRLVLLLVRVGLLLLRGRHLSSISRRWVACLRVRPLLWRWRVVLRGRCTVLRGRLVGRGCCMVHGLQLLLLRRGLDSKLRKVLLGILVPSYGGRRSSCRRGRIVLRRRRVRVRRWCTWVSWPRLGSVWCVVGRGLVPRRGCSSVVRTRGLLVPWWHLPRCCSCCYRRCALVVAVGRGARVGVRCWHVARVRGLLVRLGMSWVTLRGWRSSSRWVVVPWVARSRCWCWRLGVQRRVGS
mmetsp:Transcript_36494/g.92158  ORF Transcript_36494/g.92158 Transcript_36494/m.92158 type:complete len:254 (-) Transcript_36494:208-969(-)